jgi:asparagine synthase (glutamine-hydrolysing)
LSAFAVVYERSNTPVKPGVLERVMKCLSHRGPDGKDAILGDHYALGHWHFWTTPEEVGERQPLELAGMPFKIVFDGRLDNRSELISELNINSQEGTHLTDAALILRSYANWGESCLTHFIGEFALVILDERSGRLFIARDPLGERTLFYTWQETSLIIASEPWAAANPGDNLPNINENAVVRYFAWAANEDGQTLFKNVFEVLPAHCMTVNAANTYTRRYWSPKPVEGNRRRSDADYADEFRSLLEISIRERMRCNKSPAILMSGGLDSGSVACLAARMTLPIPLTAISYVFDELIDCDERKHIAEIVNQWKIRSIQFPGDQAWPLHDWQKWLSNPNQPCGNPLHLLMELSYKRAKEEGINVLLTGGGGDQLYGSGTYWLSDLLRDGKLQDAFRGSLDFIQFHGLRQFLAAGFLQHAGRRLLNAFPGGNRLHRRQRVQPWLTPLSQQMLQENYKKPLIAERYHSILGMGVASSYSGETFYASSYGIELRHPYRDRRLVEFVLQLPAYQLFNHGMNKPILRTAMQGILPEHILASRRSNSFNPLFIRGIEREKKAFQAHLENPETKWGKYVNSEWLQKSWRIILKSGKLRPQGAVVWDCISYEAWFNSLNINHQNSL